MQLQERIPRFLEKGVAIVAVSNDPVPLARRAKTQWGLVIPVLTSEGTDALDVLGIRHPKAHHGRDAAVPTLVLVDGTGRVRRTYQARQSQMRLPADVVARWLDG